MKPNEVSKLEDLELLTEFLNIKIEYETNCNKKVKKLYEALKKEIEKRSNEDEKE